MTRGRPALLQALAGGDLRSIGAAERIVDEVLGAPERFGQIVAGFDDPDPVIRMRASDVAEKVSRVRPDLLKPHTAKLLTLMAASADKEVRWHLAQMTPRLPLVADDRSHVVERLIAWLDDESRIVQASALSALADLTTDDAMLRRRVLAIAETLVAIGSPALKARARRTLKVLRKPGSA